MSTVQTIPAQMEHFTPISAERFAESRQAEVVAAISAVDDLYREYLSTGDDDPAPIAPLFWDKCYELVAAVGRLPLPAVFGPHISTLEKFASGLCSVIAMGQREQHSGTFWGNVEEVAKIPQAIASQQSLPFVEPMRVLFEQGVSEQQIAKMTGHTINDVCRERDEPGCITGAEGYVLPIHRRATEEMRARAGSWSTGVALSACLAKLQAMRASY